MYWANVRCKDLQWSVKYVDCHCMAKRKNHCLLFANQAFARLQFYVHWLQSSFPWIGGKSHLTALQEVNWCQSNFPIRYPHLRTATDRCLQPKSICIPMEVHVVHLQTALHPPWIVRLRLRHHIPINFSRFY